MSFGGLQLADDLYNVKTSGKGQVPAGDTSRLRALGEDYAIKLEKVGRFLRGEAAIKDFVRGMELPLFVVERANLEDRLTYLQDTYGRENPYVAALRIEEAWGRKRRVYRLTIPTSTTVSWLLDADALKFQEIRDGFRAMTVEDQKKAVFDSFMWEKRLYSFKTFAPENLMAESLMLDLAHDYSKADAKFREWAPDHTREEWEAILDSPYALSPLNFTDFADRRPTSARDTPVPGLAGRGDRDAGGPRNR